MSTTGNIISNTVPAGRRNLKKNIEIKISRFDDDSVQGDIRFAVSFRLLVYLQLSVSLQQQELYQPEG